MEPVYGVFNLYGVLVTLGLGEDMSPEVWTTEEAAQHALDAHKMPAAKRRNLFVAPIRVKTAPARDDRD